MDTPAPRKPYPTDVTDDEEWAFVAPYLTLMTPDAGQRKPDLRAVSNAVRWLAAGCFEVMVDDLRLLLRWLQARTDTSRCCPGGEWWSASSPGRAGSSGWCETSNTCRRQSLGCILSRSRA